MKLKFLVTALLFTLFGFAQRGTVTGTVTDKEMKNEALPFATVLIKGTTNGVNTDEQGKYTLSVSEGNHILVISYLGYETVEIPFTIKNNETKIINQGLGAKGVELQDVIVTTEQNREKETALLVEQKKAVEIKQSIGAQELSRKGVSDVEEGLTKITGITKVESRGLFVRGLEDRYNNLLINDLQAPSNSPFKKIIPLDLFPTDIVGVLNVYKTFNPNISGDFAGATVNIETSQARGSQTKVNVGFGYTTNNNGEDFLISQDANTTQGFLGLVGKDRELPSVFGNVPSAYQMTSTQYKESHKQNTWNVDKSSSPINNSFGFLHTDRFKFKNDNSVNYIISLNAENKYIIREGLDRTFNQGLGNYDKNFILSQYKYQTASSALAGLKYKAKFGSLAFNSFYLRSTESTIQDQFGYNGSAANDPTRLIRLNQFEESNYFNNQLLGNFNITSDGKHSIKAGGSFVKTSFQQPDRKTLIGNRVNETDIEMSYGGINLNRQYLDVKGNYYFSGLLEYNWKFGQEIDGKSNRLSLGYNTFKNKLKSTYRFLGNPVEDPNNNPEFITNLNDIDAHISADVENGIVRFREESNTDYKIKLDHFVNAGYATLFRNFGPKVEVNAGVRFENSDRTIKYRRIGEAAFTVPYRLNKQNELSILPSINAKYSINEKSNLRFAASKTMTRPTTSELLPIQYVNPDGTVELGNYALTRGIALNDPNLYLRDSENINADLKYELFTDRKEMVALGVFGKSIDKPIERIFIPTASSGGQITTFANSKSAILYGAELELILQFSRLSEQLDKLSLGFNTSIMQTEVKTDLVNNPLENSSKRKLQGASNWLINADLKYDFNLGKNIKNTASLVYGVYGKRIYAVGTAGLDHIYEMPFSKLDFIWSSKLSKNIDVKFAVDNILNPYYRQEMGDESTVTLYEDSLVLREYKRGVGYSLNISYTF